MTRRLFFLLFILFVPLPACAAAPFVTDSIVTSTITSTTITNSGTITTNAMTATTISPGTVSATTFTAGSTLPSPIISGTVTGGANYTAPTLTNPVFSGTSSGNISGATINNVSIGATTPNSGKFTTINETNLLISNSAPVIFSGFCSSPSISVNNGTASFRINVGTGCATSAGILTMPTAATGWNCFVSNVTAKAGNRADNTVMNSVADNPTTVYPQNQTTSTGNAVNWTSGDILTFSCFAY